MKNHPGSTASIALTTVAALFLTAWASLAVAQEPAGTTWAFSQQGVKYEVFRRRDDRPEHHGALIYIVQTRKTGHEKPHGLVFLQTRGSVFGQGFVEANCTPMQDDPSLTCEQVIGNKTETLIIGAINSKACDNLRTRNENPAKNAKTTKDTERPLTPEGKNPVATPEECANTQPGGCICYDISNNDHRDFPPNSGSGTGGHH